MTIRDLEKAMRRRDQAARALRWARQDYADGRGREESIERAKDDHERASAQYDAFCRKMAR
jgi:hypothetical protein